MMDADAAQAAQAEHPQRVRSRNFLITTNNPTPAERVLWPDGLSPNITALVYQIERGAEGTEHVQAFISLKNPIAPTSVKKLTFQNAEGATVTPFARSHIEVCRDVAASIAYCKKEETRVAGPWEMGVAPVNKGKRTDLEEATKTLIETGGDLNQIDPVVFVRYCRGLQLLIQLRVPAPTRPNFKVITIVGSTNVGKSWIIHNLYPDLVKCQWGNSGSWFPGYVGQLVIAFEEFKGQIPLQRMLQYLDQYPIHIEQKGSSYPLRATLCFITSNSTPDQWYKNDPMHPREEELNALYRRLDYVPPPQPGEPAARASGIRYIVAGNRRQLHRDLDLALSIEDLAPKPPHTACSVDAADIDMVAAMDMSDLVDPPATPLPPDEPTDVAAWAPASPTQVVSSDEESSSTFTRKRGLKRRNAQRL